MRLFGFIMAVYLLALSCMPCADEGNQAINVKSETLITHTADSHDHGSEHCTPVCICACCSIFMESQAQQSFSSAKPDFFIRKYQIRKTTLSSLYPNDIWQPPKINA